MEVIAGVAAAGAVATWIARQIRKVRTRKDHKDYLREEEGHGSLGDGSAVPVVQGSLGDGPIPPHPHRRPHHALTYGGGPPTTTTTRMRIEEPLSPRPMMVTGAGRTLLLLPSAPPMPLLENGWAMQQGTGQPSSSSPAVDPILASQHGALVDARGRAMLQMQAASSTGMGGAAAAQEREEREREAQMLQAHAYAAHAHHHRPVTWSGPPPQHAYPPTY
jgi:hypothetical protein